jgi:hypothetical protein
MSLKVSPSSEETTEQTAEPDSQDEETPAAQAEIEEQAATAQTSVTVAGLNDLTTNGVKALFSELGAVVEYATLPPNGASGNGNGNGNGNVSIINVAVVIGNNQMQGGVGNGLYGFTDVK